MKLMFLFLQRSVSVFAIIGMLFVVSSAVNGQSKRSTDRKAASAKASTKEKQKQTSAKNSNSKSTAAKDKNSRTAANDARNGRDDRDSRSGRSKRDPRREAEERRAAAERERIDEERRQAALAEQRRREQAAREARERKLAFERGLRTETVANISQDRTDGEDMRIRRAAIDALGSRAGSVVVMEAKTGRLLTVVNQGWAVRDSIKPCSTIKLVTGVAGLSEKIVDPETGAVRGANTRRLLDDAYAFSDNAYFQRVGANLGNEKMNRYARDLGLGQPTGVNLAGEVAGRMPINNNNARIYSHGDDFEVTPLQLAVMVSAITNGGNRVVPRVPFNSVDKASFQTFYRAKLQTDQKDVRRVIPGMMGAAAYGTAHRGVDASMGVAGKTGSCISKGTWVGLFASVAPVESPKYAVVVVTRGQGERGKFAAAVAGRVYEALRNDIVRTDRNLAQTEFHINNQRPAARPQTNSSAVRAADADDDDDDDDGEAPPPASSFKQVIRTVPPVVIENRPKVQRTGSSRPVFPPVVITYDRDKADDQQ